MKRTLIAVTAFVALTACTTDNTSQEDSAVASTTTTVAETPPTTATAEPTPADDLYGVTPDGLTTAVNVPTTLTDDEFAAGCAEAKAALETFGSNDPQVLLAMMQAGPENASGNVSVDDSGSWSSETPEDQANLIATVNAAAAGDC
ncbi:MULTISPECIES: lipoprotein LpqV [unclassified Rhodococcus (in: high G+C Gram-positive bacteria)]|uniref:lipoprotein LpqV n=1 Tax=unclassified Rhodococcus (in: high G+C Gram-positive bacteria) TaxID=192944 RepID=UPI000B9C414E|nr:MULTISPECIES: lipoprotein LpqV [unclassified Rhodococcus (in: high G+C Gram-positive bacteria)]OZE35574.1 hypothetical protein CH259_16225 [Rhodococcus sp. 05-2254-4]OZE48003.1 hypothetical protein CH261_08820 [Rhodococcus sp. 05-2254-3]OZE49214.1 hypothetical protein CH283_16605 [Rhodococcus sp. 05-2254-2]